MAAYISRTTATSFTSRQKFTASMWVKEDTPPPADVYWWSIGSGGAHITIYAAANGGINVIGGGPSANWYQYGTICLKDPTAWYHVVLSVDTTQSVANDRIKLYINGTLYADDAYWNSRSYPDEDDELDALVSGKIQYISSNYGASGREIKQGLMSHVHYCDGYNYTASDFGETDSTSGIWKIKTSPSVTYGNNGYFLKMEDRTNLDLDSGTNAFTFTTTGTLTATYDNPSNNFATLNPLNVPVTPKPVFSNGNNTVVTQDASGKYFGGTSTLGMVGGKWYCEFKADSLATDGMVGINGASGEQARQNGQMSYSTSGFGYMNDGQKSTNLTDTSYGNSWTTANVIGVAVDLDNLKIYFAKDNTWQDSGDPTSGATGTGAAFTILAASATPEGFYAFGCGDKSTGSSTLSVNFGNGYFGTTAVTSAEADGAGIGAFEFAPPTGYYALCTKNIKAYGG